MAEITESGRNWGADQLSMSPIPARSAGLASQRRRGLAAPEVDRAPGRIKQRGRVHLGSIPRNA